MSLISAQYNIDKPLLSILSGQFGENKIGVSLRMRPVLGINLLESLSVRCLTGLGCADLLLP
jgi:hypothetical protein